MNHYYFRRFTNPAFLLIVPLDQEVLDFMAYREQRRGAGRGARAPTTNRRRQPWQVALDSALTGAMLNESSDYEVSRAQFSLITAIFEWRQLPK